jgi:hypothetical protein
VKVIGGSAALIGIGLMFYFRGRDAHERLISA